MVTKDVQTLNLKFDQVMFNSLGFTWERNFEVTFGLEQLLKFLANFTLLKYVESQRSYGFLITKS